MEIAVVKWKSFVSPGWVASALLLSANPANASLFLEEGFQQLYLLNIPNTANYNLSAPAYSVDNSGAIADGSFDRVAYYLELQQAEGAMQWVWASFDTPSAITTDLGVPGNAGSGQTFDHVVTNMNVFSSAGANVTTGIGFTTGNIEFWSSNYGKSADGPATGGTHLYDFDDSGFSDGSGYGSMQVHNHGVGETLLAFNRWGTNNQDCVLDLGIGNNPGGGVSSCTGANWPDWTFANNASTYTVKNLEVWVNGAAIPAPATLALFGIGLFGAGLVRRRSLAA
jgi:hypothetical protein